MARNVRRRGIALLCALSALAACNSVSSEEGLSIGQTPTTQIGSSLDGVGLFKIERTDQSGVFSGVFVPSQPMTSEQTMEKMNEMLKLYCGADPIFGDVIVVTSSRPDVGYDDHPVGSRHASFTCGLPKP